MIDIVEVTNDIQFFNTNVMRASNILSVQLGDLEYAQDLGIDLRFFLSEDFKFQNESFKAYMVEVLAQRGIDVASVAEIVESLFSKYTFNLTGSDDTTGMIAR